MGGFDIVLWYLLWPYIILVIFVVVILADYLGWIGECCPQSNPKEDNENIQGEKEESDNYLELCIWD